MGSLQAHSGLSNLSFKTKKAKIHSNLLGLKQVSLSGVTFINGKKANLERARESQRPIPNNNVFRFVQFYSRELIV